MLVSSWKCVCILSCASFLFYGRYHILCIFFIARVGIVALTHSFAFLQLLKVLLTLALLHRFLVGSLLLAVNTSECMHYCKRARASSTHVREVYVQFEISLTRIC